MKKSIEADLPLRKADLYQFIIESVPIRHLTFGFWHLVFFRTNDGDDWLPILETRHQGAGPLKKILSSIEE
jgi:hypothetical protein